MSCNQTRQALYVPYDSQNGGAFIRVSNLSSSEISIGSTLERLNLQSNHWLKQVENYQKNYVHVVGSMDKIRGKARQLKKRCLRGISAAKLAYL